MKTDQAHRPGTHIPCTEASSMHVHGCDLLITCGGSEERDWEDAPGGGGVSLLVTVMCNFRFVLCEVLSSLLQTLQSDTLCVMFNVH